MTKSLKLIIALAAVALLIGAYFIITNLPKPQPVFRSVTEDRIYFLNARESDLVKMEFIRNDGTRLHFERDERGQWAMKYPSVTIDLKDGSIEDIAFTMSSVFAEQLIDETPEDISIYGLNEPIAEATIGTKDGAALRITVGARTPTGVAYYIRKNDDEAVYTLRSYTVERFFTKIADMRDRDLMVPNVQEVQYFRLTSDRTLEIVPMSDDDDFVGSNLASLKVIKPYARPKAIDSQRFSEMLETFPGIYRIEEFIEDDVRDFRKYGLNPPRFEFELRDSESRLVLQIGSDQKDGYVYAKVPQYPTVFTLAKGNLNFLDIRPFRMVDKFILIPNIDTVDRFTITAEGAVYAAEVKREKNLSAQEGADDIITTYLLNNVEIEEGVFKKFYQRVIGLLADAENPTPRPLAITPDVSIAYELNKGGEPTPRVDFRRVDRDFYAAYRYGAGEFLVSNTQIRWMLDGAAELLRDK